ncbi:MAG TPA: hypothetical protein PLM10_01840 [Saccharofermentans sp.]|jgi:hypothetical protein|nr:hypothetical protein [Clostridia bacterium]NLX68062.1 hypothetical protein [Clostridiaceae bacterium]HOO49275.1 hypothetical protein [Saccharofermentans sp.]HPE27584.1 hypothetical protein [Saccharofermentans sp.]HPJ82103.1 hypothetical protein [Saccharofermentans sp.]
MAFSILLLENSTHLVKLLKARLSLCFEDAYIRQVIDKTYDFCEQALTNSTYVFYDDKQFSPEFVDSFCNTIPGDQIHVDPLFIYDKKHGRIIDCSRLAHLINSNSLQSLRNDDSSATTPKSERGSFHLLLPFSYINEREEFIRSEFLSLRDSSDICVRLNLMSGTRIPSYFTTRLSDGTLTSLLKKAKNGSLLSSDILESTNPDMFGFLTPGNPDHADDVFDFGIEVISSLLSCTRDLTFDTSQRISVLAVAEGFRMNEYLEFAKYVDHLHILLPGRMYEESTGYQDQIDAITRQLPSSSKVSVYYSEDYKAGTNYETVKL